MFFFRWSFGKKAKAYGSFCRSVAHSRGGRCQEAVDEFSKAIDLDPDFGTYYHFRSEAFLKTGNFGNPIEDFEKAWKPKDPSS